MLDGCAARGIRAVEADPHGGRGGRGCLDLADAVWEIATSGEAAFRPLYPDHLSLREKIETVATKIYGADGVDFQGGVTAELERLESFGLAGAPVCIAKTQYSFSDDPALLGRPRGFRITVRDVTPSGRRGLRGGQDRLDHDNAGAGGQAGGAQHDHRRGRGDFRADVAARGQNPPGIRPAMHPGWPLRSGSSHCNVGIT